MSVADDGLGSINPDDPRPVSQQIANQLRAAILTGRYKPGERLPSQNDLTERYDVARETVDTALQEPLAKIRAGRLTPETIAVRILLPDMTMPAAVPSLADGQDEPAVRERHANISRRHTEAIVDSVHELGELGLVQEA